MQITEGVLNFARKHNVDLFKKTKGCAENAELQKAFGNIKSQANG